MLLKKLKEDRDNKETSLENEALVVEKDNKIQKLEHEVMLS